MPVPRTSAGSPTIARALTLRVLASLLLALAILPSAVSGQGLSGSAAPPPSLTPSSSSAAATSPNSASLPGRIPLVVRKGTAIQVVLDKEVRVERVGQPIVGRVVVPIYAFDKLVMPVGAQLAGRITAIGVVSAGKRTLSALNADFTPYRLVRVDFDELLLPDGRRIPVQTTVTPGSGQVIEFVTAPEKNDKKQKGLQDAAEERARKAREEARRQWDAAVRQVHESGKMHRIEKYLVAQMPVHPQYLDPGTIYFADLLQPLDFGSEPLSPEVAASLGSPPPPGSVLQARLITPLSSASTPKGAKVEALVSQPLFDGPRLLVAEGSLLEGSVVQVQAARGEKRNGQLRIAFREFVPPDGVEEKVEAALEGVQAAQLDHLRLDSESGVQATSPRSRYVMSGIAVALAVVASNGDGDADVLNRTAGDAGGYKLLGIGMGLAIHSQPLGMAMGAFGAARSIYARFLSRGRDVEFPRDTAMEIGFGPPASSRAGSPPKQ